MKIERHGKAKALTQAEVQKIFTEGLETPRDKAICAVMLFTACRVNECVTLRIVDVYDKKGRIRNELILRKGNTKGKTATRTIPVADDLRRFLEAYQHPISEDGFLFPGRWGRSHIHVDSARIIFRKACERVDIVGASTHSMRRTSLTAMSNAGTTLRVLQEISGHVALNQLQTYLEVESAQVRGAIATLALLDPLGDSCVTKSSTDVGRESLGMRK